MNVSNYTMERSSTSAPWFSSFVSTLSTRISNLFEIRSTLDIKPSIERALESRTTLLSPAYLSAQPTCYLAVDPQLMSDVFKHHRNDPEGIFVVSEQRLDLMKLFFPEEHPHVNDFILSCDPEHSRKYRSLLLKAFTPAAVELNYSSQIKQLVSETLDRWSLHEGEINMSHEIHLFVCTVISKFVLGYSFESVNFSTITDAVNCAMESYVRKIALVSMDKERLASAQHLLKTAVNTAYEEATTPFTKMLKEQVESRDLTLIQAKALIYTLFIAGQETSATVLTEIFWQLANQPELQDRLADQSQKIEPVIIEALRTKPPAFAIGRALRVPLTISKEGEGSQTIPAGDVITSCPFAAAKDPAAYPRPEHFDPTRHTNRTHMPWLPFGEGAHRCPGRNLFWNEALELIRQTFLRFKLSTPQTEKPKSKGQATDVFVEDLLIRLTARTQPH